MKIQAVNNLSFQNFEGKMKPSKKHHSEINNGQNKFSREAVNAMRSLVLAGMIMGAAGAVSTSCTSESFADSFSITYGLGCDCPNKKDTVYIKDRDTIFVQEIVPQFVKEYPKSLSDSLVAQGLNLGLELDGPKPNSNNNAVFIASNAYNRYDRRYYETSIDPVKTNREQLSLLTKVVDMYDERNPKTFWMNTIVRDLPGEGIKFDRYVCNREKAPGTHESGLWNYSNSEVRTNNHNGQNLVRVYDSNYDLVYRGEYKKGQDAGAFMFGTIITDENGEPYYDDNGQPEKVDYNFDQGKMFTSEMKEIQTENDSEFVPY